MKSIADVVNLSKTEQDVIIDNLLDKYAFKNGISDIFSGLTNDALSGGYHHESDYWQQLPDNLEAETIAHFFEVLGVGGQKKAILKEYFPTAFEYFEIFIKGVI